MPKPTPSFEKARRMTVRVMQADIDGARQANSNKCAIARAIASSLPTASHISVDVASIRFTHDGGSKRSYYMTPAKVQRFIFAFDAGEPVEPFEFALRDGTTHAVARRPGVGGRPRGTVVSSKTRPPKVQGRTAPVQNSGRRTYGARSMTPAVQSAAVTAAKSHA